MGRGYVSIAIRDFVRDFLLVCRIHRRYFSSTAESSSMHQCTKISCARTFVALLYVRARVRVEYSMHNSIDIKEDRNVRVKI